MPLVSYDDDSDDDQAQGAHQTAMKKTNLAAAPTVSIGDPLQQAMVLSKDSEKILSTNISYEDMVRPLQGPANPFSSISNSRKNIITGYAEVQSYNEAYFREQYQQHSATISSLNDAAHSKTNKEKRALLKRKRETTGELTALDGTEAWRGPWAKYKNEAPSEAGSLASDEEYEPETLAPALQPEFDRGRDIRVETNHGAERSEFYGSSMLDYQGRTYMHVPQNLDIDLRKEPGEQECFVPKKLIHTWNGHQKGISALRFFPKSGHLLLSASTDSKVMLWDCHNERELLRDYAGHSKAVRDINFNADGSKFLSAGYDSHMKLWDTETGQCITKFTTGKIPYVVKIHPELGKNEFLAGMSNNKIVQFDMSSGEIVQEYDHHLGPVNTITYVNENRRFITTSDDKSLRAWEYGIPVPIKLIAEPEMLSMPSVAPHPSGKYIACQSLDSQIVVYSAIDKVKVQRRKQFRGHGCGGYGIEVSFSPDGKYLSSGDAGGYACFWDWKTCKLVSKFSAHKGPLTHIQWNPQETSKVATGGNDGSIHYWD
ncbi:putative MRNA splicing factor [Taphrina deformans PYCC 5710]|uniref:Pre-mRNA-processing factor 17 n=1 Tax=Taphrina deformans (strain PYCC 5710 / ATCC 11124 / CBS 356.35 / IMI 108563 / JCM 9778 / NBRC 8474) TaxID=1097556 RepID=R4X741_TAPDE|nr:putative MRNA splicing factor [Taphrina deformans PYCC 5710]|eukprot:CCG81066.1 putative MRNA splicing factor [Taphrina deformans PYCC 5710]